MPPVKKPADAPSDAEAREQDAARVGDDAVESRAVSVGNVINSRRRQPAPGAQYAESRGVYRTPDGDERIVGAGDVIPDGWERVSAASVEDRVGTVPTAQGDAAATSTGGAK